MNADHRKKSESNRTERKKYVAYSRFRTALDREQSRVRHALPIFQLALSGLTAVPCHSRKAGQSIGLKICAQPPNWLEPATDKLLNSESCSNPAISASRSLPDALFPSQSLRLAIHHSHSVANLPRSAFPPRPRPRPAVIDPAVPLIVPCPPGSLAKLMPSADSGVEPLLLLPDPPAS